MHETFLQRFGAAPDGVWSAPGRVNLIGEHTDYNGGSALPFAIDRRTRVALRLRDDRAIRVESTFDAQRVETSVDDVLGRSALEGWSAYVLGVARVLAAASGLSDARGFDALFDSGIPVGVGVSSSHALECSTAVALDEMWGLGLSAPDLITLTQRVEHEVVGSPTGTLDQSAILLGMRDRGVLLEFGQDPAPARQVSLGFAPAGLSVLVVDSTERHHHATGGYRVRRAECEEAAALCGVRLLGELTEEALERARPVLPELLFRRARHVVTETARVRRVADLVDGGRVAEIGPELIASHASQRDDYECSTAAIDAAVETALDRGALGARLTGGGFGGSSIALVRSADADGIAAEIASAVEAQGHPRPVVFPVVADAGAGREA